jgi:pyruvate dehydrogenase E2 component (dihydrolipoamide acetyltransferase)
MADIVMPRLSDTMEEGTILRWLKGDGEAVARGEELVEIETDKATMTYESDLEGTLQIVAAEGSTLAVGEVIAYVGGDGAAPAAGEAIAHAGGEGAAAAASEPAEGVAVTDGPAPDGPAGDGSRAAGDGVRADAPAPLRSAGRVKASPLARRLARQRGVELSAVTGSGPGGRIVRADIESAVAGGGAPAAQAAAAPGAAQATAGAQAPAVAEPDQSATIAGVATAKGETSTVALTRTQQTIARRMAESKATIPDFSVVIDVDMEECVRLREELKRLARPGAGEPAGEHVPTYNDMVVKACALALREHPRVNGSYRDGAVQLHSRVNMGVAVAVGGAGGHTGDEEHAHALVVPTVFDADSKALGEIARETRALAERVRAGTITPPELGGGTFTVSNLGMYGVRSFSAIINPPQAAIVSVGALQRRAVVLEDGSVAARNTLALTLVCDHRVLYGADAAQFAARVRELLQAPASLTL